MAEQDLLALVKRLEAVALKLESSAGAGGAGKSLLFYVSHREFLLRNGVGKTCLWKKYILLDECIQK